MALERLPPWASHITAHPTRAAVTAICAGALLWASWLGYLIQARMQTSAATVTPAAPAQPASSGLDLQAVLDANLMGSAPPADAAAATPTELALKLRAVFASGDPRSGSAIVEAEGGQPARNYRPGDALPGGATLAEVHSDHIVLEREGHRETLAFPLPGSSGASAEAVAAAAAEEAPAPAPAPETTPAPEPASDYSALSAYVGGESTADTIRKRLEEIRQRAQEARARRSAEQGQGN